MIRRRPRGPIRGCCKPRASGDDPSRIDFETEDMVCYACQHLEQEENQEGKKGGRKPGVTKIVRPVGLKYEAIGRQDPLPPPWEAMRGL